VENILVANREHTNSGILGMKFVLEALSAEGRTDVALRVRHGRSLNSTRARGG
jgi:hypothetical protein